MKLPKTLQTLVDKTKARYIITDIVNKDLEHHLLDNYTEWTIKQ